MPAYLEVGRDLLSVLWISLLYESVCRRRNATRSRGGRCERTRLRKHSRRTQAEQCEDFSNTGLCQRARERASERPQSLKNWLSKSEREKRREFLWNRFFLSFFFACEFNFSLCVFISSHRKAAVASCDGEVMTSAAVKATGRFATLGQISHLWQSTHSSCAEPRCSVLSHAPLSGQIRAQGFIICSTDHGHIHKIRIPA